EASRHEMTATTFLEEPAFGHLDLRVARHARIRVLNDRVALRVLELLVAVSAYTVEFEQPVLKAIEAVDLARANFIRFRIPGDDRLCSRAASRGPNAQN